MGLTSVSNLLPGLGPMKMMVSCTSLLPFTPSETCFYSDSHSFCFETCLPASHPMAKFLHRNGSLLPSGGHSLQ